MFKSPPVAKDVHRSDALPAVVSAYPRDTVTLGWEERVKARALRRSDLGFEFATALARGTVLRENDCFVFDVPSVVISVIERAEPVLVIRPANTQEWGVFGYHIGNSHQPVMLVENEIVCAEVPGMEQVLAYHGIPFARDFRAFTPIGRIPDHQHQLSR